MNLAQRLLIGAANQQELRVVTFIQGAVASSGKTTVSFSGVSIGAAASDRILIIVAGTQTYKANVSSITVGGTAMTKLNSTGYHFVGALAYPAGTTADITVTRSSDNAAGIAVYSLTGAGSSVQVRASAFDAQQVIGDGTLSMSSYLYELFVGDLCFWCDTKSKDLGYSRNRTPSYTATYGLEFGFTSGVFVAGSTIETVTATYHVGLTTSGIQGAIAIH